MKKQDTSPSSKSSARCVALYCEHLRGGGAEQKTLRLAEFFAGSGYRVDLLVNEAGGRYADRIPAGIRLVVLSPEARIDARRALSAVLRPRPIMRFRSRFISRNRLDWVPYVPALARYLEQNRPDLLISNLWSLALVAVCARIRARCKTRLICVFRSAFFSEIMQRKSMRRHPLRWRQFFYLCRSLYAEADALVTVSRGVANDLIDIVGVRPDTVRVLPNPVIEPGLTTQADQPLDDGWIEDNRPLLLAVGRLSAEKNYAMLLCAVARLKPRCNVRLMIVGEGGERGHLEETRNALGLVDDVLFPGWDNNPYRWMRRASVVVLCSNWEGLPTTLIEAMACGTPVIATDCRHGPREILENGRLGELVPIDDAEAMAGAIERTLAAPVDARTLVESAQRYSVETSRSAFLDLAADLL